MDFGNMSNEELRQLASAVEKEMAIRRQYKQEQLWGEVREAIRKYCEEFGSITIYLEYSDSVYLNERCDFSSIGEITTE